MVKCYKALVSLSDKQSSINKDIKTTANVATESSDSFITYSVFSAATRQDSIDHFLIDTGANTHVVAESSLLHDIQPIDPVKINGIAGSTGHVTASFKGSATILCHSMTGARRTVEIKDVLLVPNAGVNLLAVSKLTKDGA